MPLAPTDGIKELGLDNATLEALRRDGKHHVGDILALCGCGVLEIPGIAWSNMEEISGALEYAGLTLNKACKHRVKHE